ncbi:uncharacterized protein F5147DRAFT_278841 [Suillus discolor]|uniref:Uncharacterized protein n=1 Tax=Suillus discolor TaxID=1912936 RepID=A0A9P7F301_9AGAM|nr:uncharacterized protein F5147DRAFT_278841 [Suillus discolor]KAG2103414.1 hypothetical protein F5147DRAFT_278841 [Suillus discolor]
MAGITVFSISVYFCFFSCISSNLLSIQASSFKSIDSLLFLHCSLGVNANGFQCLGMLVRMLPVILYRTSDVETTFLLFLALQGESERNMQPFDARSLALFIYRTQRCTLHLIVRKPAFCLCTQSCLQEF